MRPGATNGLQTFVVLGYMETSLQFLHDCHEHAVDVYDHDENHAQERIYQADTW